MDRYESNGHEVATLDEGGFLTSGRDPAPPVQHWSNQIETPLLPVNEILEIVANEIGIENEVWTASPEQVDFRERVLKAHIALRSQGGRRKPATDLPQSALAKVPGTARWMRSDAAAAAGRMLADAGKALAEARASGDADARRTRALGATSGYRSPKRQYELWREYFPKYYAKTQAERAQVAGGEHGDAARQIALQETAQWIAAPGFSNHNNGIAIDLAQIRMPGARIRNTSNASDLTRWRRSWFHKWLVANAESYGFSPYAKEPWHWEYKPRPAVSKLDELDQLEPSYELDELGETELDENELAAEPAAEELWGIPFFPPVAPAATPDRARLVASCLPVVTAIPRMTAKYSSPRTRAIDEIVLHDTSSGRNRRWADAKAYLADPSKDNRKVSIHYMIGREDDQIVSMVPESRQAWHATSHNPRSVGIELFMRRGRDTGFSDWQYRAVSQLVYDLMLRHSVPAANIVAHKWIDPTRRDDPRNFDWPRFRQTLVQIADCARTIDPSLVVSDVANAGGTRATSAAPAKELDATETLDGDRELDELGEESLDEYETPTLSVVDRVKAALQRGLWSGAAALMIGSGVRDERRITNIIFRSRHPELSGRRIRPDETALAAEWTAIRER